MADEEDVANLAVRLGFKVNKAEAKEASETLEAIKKGMEYFAGFEAVKGLFELVEHTTEAAVASKHLAEQLGVSVEAVQELGYAADVTGASTETMRGALQHLSFGMQQASKTGSGPLVDGLSKLHISFAEFKKAKPDEQLEMLADGFKKAGPEVNKTAVSMAILGRRAGAMIPLLNKGAEGVKELREEFKSLGGETSAEQAEQLEKFEESQKKVKYLWEGIKFDAVMAILPTLQDLVKTLFDWVKANRELISTSIVNLMHALATAFRIVGTAVGAFMKFFNFISQDGDAVKAILIGIATAIGYVAGAALLAWVNGQLMMVGWVGLLVGVIYGVMKLIDLFEYLWEGVEDGSGWALAAFGGLVAVVGILGVALFAAFGADFLGMIWLAVDAVLALAASLWATVAPIIAQTVALLADPITWIVLAVIAAVALLAYGIYELVENWDEVVDAVKRFASSIEDFFVGAFRSVEHAWDNLLKWMSNKWDNFKKDHPWIAKGISVTASLVKGAAKMATFGVAGGVGAAYDATLGSHEDKGGGGDTTNNVTAQIDVHASPGMDEDKLAAATKDQFNDMWDEKVRTAHAGAGIG